VIVTEMFVPEIFFAEMFVLEIFDAGQPLCAAHRVRLVPGLATSERVVDSKGISFWLCSKTRFLKNNIFALIIGNIE
jgi:hypothetical protein